eukprot:12380667-Alexandrium_andersonii.AAC.1
MERRVGHHDSAATRNGIGVWVITLEHTCTTAELRTIAQHMPPRSAVEFFGDPSRGSVGADASTTVVRNALNAVPACLKLLQAASDTFRHFRA